MSCHQMGWWVGGRRGLRLSQSNLEAHSLSYSSVKMTRYCLVNEASVRRMTISVSLCSDTACSCGKRGGHVRDWRQVRYATMTTYYSIKMTDTMPWQAWQTHLWDISTHIISEALLSVFVCLICSIPVLQW